MRIKHNNTVPVGSPSGTLPDVVVALRSVAVAPTLYRLR